jgi:hypothetical protein
MASNNSENRPGQHGSTTLIALPIDLMNLGQFFDVIKQFLDVIYRSHIAPT